MSKAWIESKLKSISENSFESELVILKDSYEEYKTNGYAEWEGVENMNELRETLMENIGKHVTLIGDPDFCNEQNTFHLYIPDKYRISKPGYVY